MSSGVRGEEVYQIGGRLGFRVKLETVRGLIYVYLPYYVPQLPFCSGGEWWEYGQAVRLRC